MQGREQPTPDTPGMETTEIINRRWLSKNAFELELTRPRNFHFKAGHTIRLLR